MSFAEQSGGTPCVSRKPDMGSLRFVREKTAAGDAVKVRRNAT
jgi:hypothetical protein